MKIKRLVIGGFAGDGLLHEMEESANGLEVNGVSYRLKRVEVGACYLDVMLLQGIQLFANSEIADKVREYTETVPAIQAMLKPVLQPIQAPVEWSRLPQTIQLRAKPRVFEN